MDRYEGIFYDAEKDELFIYPVALESALQFSLGHKITLSLGEFEMVGLIEDAPVGKI